MYVVLCSAHQLATLSINVWFPMIFVRLPAMRSASFAS